MSEAAPPAALGVHINCAFTRKSYYQSIADIPPGCAAAASADDPPTTDHRLEVLYQKYQSNNEPLRRATDKRVNLMFVKDEEYVHHRLTKVVGLCKLYQRGLTA